MHIFLPISLDQWRSPIASLLRAVVKHCPEHHFASFSNPVSDEDREKGQEFWRLPNIRQLNPRWAWRERFDLVHTAALNPRNLSIAAFSKVRGLGRTRFLTTINLEYDPGLPVRDWRCFQAALRLADAFVAVSEAAARPIRERAPDRFLGVIPNGFDSTFFDPEEDASRDLPDVARSWPHPFALFVSALEPRKHPDFFVKLAQANPDLPFVAAGWVHPLYGSQFEPLFRGHENLLWLGHINQRTLRALLQRAGVLVFPSEREGLPLTVIEALGMGVPVLAQPKSSLPELVKDGENGMLALIDGAGSLARWGEEVRLVLRRGAEERSRLGRAYRTDMVSRFDWEAVGEAYRGLYARLA